MSQFYNPQRIKNLYDPTSKIPFTLSRSKLELFIKCPFCFYLDRRLGVNQPSGPSFSLNSAVDKLLKKEFDIHRAKGQAHPLMDKYKVDAIPLAHEKIDEWRNALGGGIKYLHVSTNFLLKGGIDDIWVNPAGEYIIVDYKSTSKDEEITLEDEWKISYKRQMEIYQWLFRKNGFRVSDVGYFVYCNGDTDREAFDAKLEFEITLLPYKGDDTWIEKAVVEAHKCLNLSEPPLSSSDCDFCLYRQALSKATVRFPMPEVQIVQKELVE